MRKPLPFDDISNNKNQTYCFFSVRIVQLLTLYVGFSVADQLLSVYMLSLKSESYQNQLYGMDYKDFCHDMEQKNVVTFLYVLENLTGFLNSYVLNLIVFYQILEWFVMNFLIFQQKGKRVEEILADQSSGKLDSRQKTYKMKEMLLNKVINVSIALFMILSAAIEISNQMEIYKESPVSLSILNLVLLMIYLTQFVILHT